MGGSRVSIDAKSPAASISPAQCRAARALMEMDQAELARRAVVSRDTIADFENGSRTPAADGLDAIRAALEAAGVIFIDENGNGLGVRLRKRRR
jgi:transcriptional regulator with XRE-family HTH domain